MGEAVMDLLDAHEFNGDESLIVAARFLDFNGNHNDESTSVEMIVDGFERIRNKMKNRLLGLADTLDQTIAKHAEEKALYEQQNEANVEDLQRKLNLIQRTLNDVLKDNNAKSLANRRVNQFLWLIREQIGSFFNDQQEQVACETITVSDNDETDDAEVDNNDDIDDNNGNDGHVEQQIAAKPLDNTKDVAAVEQNDLDVEMAPADDVGANETATIQPANEEGTAELPSPAVSAAPAAAAAAGETTTSTNTTLESDQFLQPAPVTVSATHPGVALVQQQSNSSEPGPSVGNGKRKQCFWCEESFIKESSLRNHIKSDHNLVLMKQEPEESDQDNEPGKYVRPPMLPMKRKRTSLHLAENDDADENRATAISQQHGKRKHAKTVHESMRRSIPRI